MRDSLRFLVWDHDKTALFNIACSGSANDTGVVDGVGPIESTPTTGGVDLTGKVDAGTARPQIGVPTWCLIASSNIKLPSDLADVVEIQRVAVLGFPGR